MKMKTAAQEHGLVALDSWAKIKNLNTDIFVICVSISTGITNEGKPDLSSIYDACEKVQTLGRENVLGYIESTVVPGTRRKISREYQLLLVVHCSHRYWVDNPVRHGVDTR